jgi:hypothetical protein
LHESAAITPGTALRKVTLPNKSILVEGAGTGAVQLQTKPESNIPVVGALFNHTVANLADKSTSTKRTGVVQVGTLRNAITLRPYPLPGAKTGAKKEWGIQANVNVKRLFSQASMHPALDSNGNPQVKTDDDWFAFETVDGAAKRGIKVSDIADSIFKRECGTQLLPIIPAGVMVQVKDQLRATAGLLEALPGDGDKATAKALSNMAQKPIKVAFVKPAPAGQRGFQAASLKDIQLPTATPFTSASLAKSMGKSPDTVHLEQNGSCTFTGPAARQYNNLLNRSNGVQPLKPGL